MSLGSGEWSIVILIGQEKRTSHPKEDERIFTISKSYLHHEMNRGSKISGVKRIRVYDLRHSHVSLLINMGFPVLAIADRMGHASIWRC